MTTQPMHTLSARLALGLGIALAAPCAFAANHTIHWLDMSPTPLGSTLPLGGGTFSSGVAGIGPATMLYTTGSGLSAVRLAHPLLQNGSLLAPNQDSYSWGAQELLARTYHTYASTPGQSGLNQNWGVSYVFNQPLAVGTQLAVGVMGLGRRLPNDASETVAETTTTATIRGLLGNYQNLGDHGSSNNWGQTVVTPAGPFSLTLVNSQTGFGGADPWWNTGLNVTVLSATQPIYVLSVMFDQTLGDGVGVNIGFINAVPEPGTWALFGAGLAAIGWLGRRRARA